ncbi:MAG: diguanylate cyclase [Sulfuritalea sp.]|nr:diguanylate cyclase [Sulfuritalea sp.]
MSGKEAVPAGDQGSEMLNFSVRLMEQLVVPTFVVDADCRVIIWNQACERLTGLKASEVVGTQEQWRAFYTEPRPCLADLVAMDRSHEIATNYEEHDDLGEDAVLVNGCRVRSWILMPQLGKRFYLTADAGPIFDETGKLVAVVETLRNMTAQKLAQDELQRLATCDGLTSVANRRSFDSTLNAEWRRATRESRTLSLLMLDVDYFKLYNDSYGHQGGDECLKRVAAAMCEVTQRSSDAVARYGGEEFAVLLPATDLAGACTVAERIRAAVENLTIPHAKSQVADHVTVSIGVASVSVSLDGVQANLVGAADAALYRAKEEGRNRVAVADGSHAAPAA